MGKLKVVLNEEGVRQMLKSGEMALLLKERAQDAVSRIGGGYNITTHTGVNRVNVSISPASYKAHKEDLKNNTIIKALR